MENNLSSIFEPSNRFTCKVIHVYAINQMNFGSFLISQFRSYIDLRAMSNFEMNLFLIIFIGRPYGSGKTVNGQLDSLPIEPFSGLRRRWGVRCGEDMN